MGRSAAEPEAAPVGGLGQRGGRREARGWRAAAPEPSLQGGRLVAAMGAERDCRRAGP